MRPQQTPVRESLAPGLEGRWDRERTAAVHMERSGEASSAFASDGPVADVPRWLAERAQAGRFRVDRIPFSAMSGWGFQEDTGNLVHSSGRFFSVEGLRVTSDTSAPRVWEQPTIRQPEVGILGILVKEFEGTPHFLLQAKMEPGNPNLVQLSPTVQATRSNYTGAHGGRPVRYIEHFAGPGRSRVLADVLQSEHGSWFYRKSNRNMLVEVGEDTDVPLHEDFCWVSLGRLGELLRLDNVVNMDTRTVLSCAPVADTERRALHSDTELLSWFTGERSRHQVRAQPVPLRSISGWVQGTDRIHHRHGRYFDVVAVSVTAGTREIGGWSQPLFEPRGLGVTAFLLRRIGGVPHLLVHARVEGGFLDTVELGPTVQYTPENYAHLPEEERPPFLDLALKAPPGRIRYQAVHSEEGGRFLNAESRYLVVEASEEQAPLDPPPGYFWVTPGQLTRLVRHGHYLNVQARTLLACINAGAVAQ